MATSRQIVADQPGPIALDATMSVGRIDVTVDPDCDRAVIVLSTRDDSGPSAEAVTDARVDQTTNTITVQVAGSGGTTIVQSGDGLHVSQTIGNVGPGQSVYGVRIDGNGTVFSSGRTVIVNGNVISGGVAGSPVVVAARVPVGSSLTAELDSGDITTVGSPLADARLRTSQGNVRIAAVARISARSSQGNVTVGATADADLRSSQGNVTVEALAGVAQLRTSQGDIRVHAVSASLAKARTSMGNVRGTGPVQLDGRSSMGRVTTS